MIAAPTIPGEPAAAPVQSTERMETLDAVRGAAVLGILLANVIAMSGLPFLARCHYRSLPLAEWHETAFFLVLFLIEAKFYSLFSLLFGVGFAVFVQRAAARGADAARLFKRRLTGLLLIGHSPWRCDRVLRPADDRQQRRLARAAFGPAEWLWRMYTYRRRVPLFR